MLASLLNNPITRWFLKMAIRHIMDHLIAAVERYRRDQAQKKIDSENLDRYNEVKTGELSDEEDIKRTEDLLNGRKP